MPTVTIRFKRLRNEEGVMDPVEEYAYTLSQKNIMKATWVSKLHNLLNCRQKSNGKSIHMPVSDILKTKGREGSLLRLRPSLQYLLDCTVLSEEKRNAYQSFASCEP